MGQKVSPIGFRLGVNRTWDSRWYADKDYATLLYQDVKLREFLAKKLKPAGISRIIIERAAKKLVVTLHAGRPGVIIGKKGADIEKLRAEVSAFAKADVALNILEIRKPELDSHLVAEGVASQLERRVSFRRAMKRAVQTTLRLGGQGIRITVSGRLGGTDIARSERYLEGRVPLHTLRANIDYATAEALTTYGIIGIKVWIYKGDIMAHDPHAQDKLMADSQPGQNSGNNRAA
jgi:small subunit ribosomal protein S3